MKFTSIISEKTASIALLIIIGLVTVFHFLVLFGVVPFEIVWGGRLESKDQMIQLEAVSIVLNVLMGLIVLIRAGYFKIKINQLFITIALWMMVGLFFINTIGNIFSNNDLEKIIFTPLTLILAILCFRLAIVKRKES